jgi:hypothetical protein
LKRDGNTSKGKKTATVDGHVHNISKELLTGKPKDKSKEPAKNAKRTEGTMTIPIGPAAQNARTIRNTAKSFNGRMKKQSLNSVQQITESYTNTHLPLQESPDHNVPQGHQRVQPVIAQQLGQRHAQSRRVFSIKNASLPPIVVIKNLADGTSREDVLAVMEDIGPVADCRCAKRDGIITAEVTFVENRYATQAVTNFDGSFADGNRLSASITRHHQIADREKFEPSSYPGDNWEGPPLYSDGVTRKKRGIIRQ